jgi:hypothetical protein
MTSIPLRLPRNVLLPVLASQGLAAALMLTGNLDFLDWQLLTLAEAWLVHLTLLAHGARGSPQATLQNFALVSLVVLPGLWLFIALLATLMVYPDDTRLPWTIVFDGTARLATERLHVALAIALTGLLVSLLQVQGERDKARWWQSRVVAQYQVNMVAMLATLFLLGPLIIVRREFDFARELPAHVVDIALLTMLAALRVLIAVRVAKTDEARPARSAKPRRNFRR